MSSGCKCRELPDWAIHPKEISHVTPSFAVLHGEQKHKLTFHYERSIHVWKTLVQQPRLLCRYEWHKVALVCCDSATSLACCWMPPGLIGQEAFGAPPGGTNWRTPGGTPVNAWSGLSRFGSPWFSQRQMQICCDGQRAEFSLLHHPLVYKACVVSVPWICGAV
jgi:hypothetical protein